LAELALADEFFLTKQGEEAVTEKFGKRLNALRRQHVEVPLLIDEPGSSEDVEMRMEIEVVAERLHGGNGGELPVGQLKPRPHPVAQALDRGTEKMIEKFSPFAENAAQGLGHRKDELSVRHVEAEDAGDPVAGGADLPLMTARAEMARLAGEGEEALVSTVRALEPREPGGEVAAAVELADDGYGVGAERTVDGAVAFLVARDEIVPAMVDDLPQG